MIIVETRGPYESEIEMLRKALKTLKKIQPQKGLPFIADKGYDAVDIIESLLDRGFEPAVRIKETIRCLQLSLFFLFLFWYLEVVLKNRNSSAHKG